MASGVYALNTTTNFAPVRVFAVLNQVGTYFNGDLNNGVGATFTYASPGALIIDNVAIQIGDSVLLSGQTAGYQNGVYSCLFAGSASLPAVLVRRGDMQCIEQIVAGYPIQNSAGALYAGSQCTIIEPLPLAIGVPPGGGSENNIRFSLNTAPGPEQFLQVSANLSDVANAVTALNNIGGLAINQNLADVADADTSLTNINGLNKNNNLSEVANPNTALTNINGLNLNNNLSEILSPAAALQNLNGLAQVNTTIAATGEICSPRISKKMVITAADLANGVPFGTIYVLNSAPGYYYDIEKIITLQSSIDFSGGGGDHGLTINDGTTVFGTLTPVQMQNLAGNSIDLINFPGTDAIPQSQPGQIVVLSYNGGTTNYAAGEITIYIEAVQRNV